MLIPMKPRSHPHCSNSCGSGNVPSSEHPRGLPASPSCGQFRQQYPANCQRWPVQQPCLSSIWCFHPPSVVVAALLRSWCVLLDSSFDNDSQNLKQSFLYLQSRNKLPKGRSNEHIHKEYNSKKNMKQNGKIIWYLNLTSALGEFAKANQQPAFFNISSFFNLTFRYFNYV